VFIKPTMLRPREIKKYLTTFFPLLPVLFMSSLLFVIWDLLIGTLDSDRLGYSMGVYALGGNNLCCTSSPTGTDYSTPGVLTANNTSVFYNVTENIIEHSNCSKQPTVKILLACFIYQIL
jgi:hypothetical protein